PTARARRAVPPLIVLPAHFDLYERFFDQILSLCRETTPLVEPAAVGSAWLDLTGTGRALDQRPEQVVAGLRATVREWLRLSISAGIATNKLVARIAARVRKPAAQLTVAAGNESAFLAPLPLVWLPGRDSRVRATGRCTGRRAGGDPGTERPAAAAPRPGGIGRAGRQKEGRGGGLERMQRICRGRLGRAFSATDPAPHGREADGAGPRAEE